ncbi:MAG TPA: DnaA/Hda family protein [Longimicrobiales bacterium]|nr:DnaA/Hda family protein [Longimicrobiales bacterium]
MTAPPALVPRFTFDNFVVGSGNRLSVAAARRVAESPGASYNPLFIYSASGLGKTHLVTSIGHKAAEENASLDVVYDTLEHFMDEAMEAIQAGERDSFRARFQHVGLMILDDVQFLAGKPRTQEELIRVWDAMSGRGGQVVLTSDRPPQEIDGLDDRLLSRFSGGLIVDIGAPDLETRVAIVRRKAEEQGQELSDGVAELLARSTFSNVRELQGALNRVLAVQELEGRIVDRDEVAQLVGGEAPSSRPSEFGDFLADVELAVDAVVSRSTEDQQLASAIMRWEADGYRTVRLESLLHESHQPSEVEAFVRAYELDVERLREIDAEIRTLDPAAPELHWGVLRDPDRLADAEAVLAAVRERRRPLPAPPPEYTFDRVGLDDGSLALRAARAAAEQPGARYNPLYLHGEASPLRSALLGALGNRIAGKSPRRPVAFMSAQAFADELIQALERNQVEDWRARYRSAGALLVEDVDVLADTERAQEELFHLFDALHRSGAQLAFTGSCPPTDLEGLEDRLRTRLGSGLVVGLADRAAAADPSPPRPEAAAEAATAPVHDGRADAFFTARDKLVWRWPYAAQWLTERDL